MKKLMKTILLTDTVIFVSVSRATGDFYLKTRSTVPFTVNENDVEKEDL